MSEMSTDPSRAPAFRRALAERLAGQARGAARRWVYVPYDQLTDEVGPLAEAPPEQLGVVMIESPWKAARRPYHQQKLAWVLANQRHFALEQAARGVEVRYVVHDGPYRSALAPLADELGPLRVMEPAERELRADLAPLIEAGALHVVAHRGWLTDRATFRAACGDPPWRMDAFYRRVRRQTGLLMQAGKPVGGKYSLDAENRRPWSGEPPAAEPPRFEPDAITLEVLALIAQRFGHHPGRLDGRSLAATRADAERLWAWARAACLQHFGPYEDAMSTRSRTIFHTRISPLLNLHRLLSRRVVRDVVEMPLPLNSKEGFIRQVIGWREFVRHVHRETDGFRRLPDGSPPIAARPGGAGWSRPPRAADALPVVDGGACPSALGADRPLPPALWGAPSGLGCLDTVVRSVMDEGYSHHITRLMVLTNLGTLLGWSPRALTDWFWSAYIDAYDWVVEPNVLGMGTFAVGDLMTTKPYVSGAAYIAKMSDYCGGCAFNPRKDCPITRLYWAFLERSQAKLAGNRRVALPMASCRRRASAVKAVDQAVFEWVDRTLAAGRPLRPSDSPAKRS